MPVLASASVADYLLALASGESAPGGGAAAALTAAQAAALVSMVCRFTSGRKRYAPFEGEVQAVLAESDGLREACLQSVDADAEAYAAVAAALKLPKDDADLGATADRKRTLQVALDAAAGVPALVAERAARVAGLATGLIGRSNASVASDLDVAVVLAGAALEAAAVNVEVNLRFLEDHSLVARYRSRLAAAREALAGARASVALPEGQAS